MKPIFLIVINGAIVLLTIGGCSKGGKQTSGDDSDSENDSERGTSDPERDTAEYNIIIRGLYNGDPITDAAGIFWLATHDLDGTREIDFDPDSDGEMTVSVRGDRYGVLYQCEADDDLEIVYATIAELTEINLLCLNTSADGADACSTTVDIDWGGIEGDGLILSGVQTVLVEPPETNIDFALSNRVPELYVADAEDGVATRLFSRSIEGVGCGADPAFTVDLIADAGLYTEHDLFTGTLIHPTDLIEDEERTVTCSWLTESEFWADSCLVTPSSPRFAVAEGAADSYIRILGTWPGGGRRLASARFGPEAMPPDTLELPLLWPTQFVGTQDTGRIPDVSVAVTPDPDALKYVLDISCKDSGYPDVTITATKGWVDAGEPLVPPVLDTTTLDLSQFEPVNHYRLRTVWSNHGLAELINGNDYTDKGEIVSEIEAYGTFEDEELATRD